MNGASQLAASVATEQFSFVAVDWGSSNLRAFLIDAQGQVLDQVQSSLGMLGLAESEFEDVLEALIGPWLSPIVPVYMAGMVGGKGGWHEVPYLSCPLALGELAQHICWLETKLASPVAIVPGVKAIGMSGFDDVMRGEETQLLGVIDEFSELAQGADYVCCLPGTHCKWVSIKNHAIAAFSTSISGELFERFSQDSSLVKGITLSSQFNPSGYTKGLQASRLKGGLLHHLFAVRSRYLCGDLAAEEVKDYLSGLIIGHDVKHNVATQYPVELPIFVVATEELGLRYREALSFYDRATLHFSSCQASIQGLTKLASKFPINPVTKSRSDASPMF